MTYKDAIEAFVPMTEQEHNDRKILLDFISQHPDTILTRENQVAHLTSSGIILNETLDKMLMVHHNIYNTWAWTGGHADGNDNLFNVATQEIEEETGLDTFYPLSEEIYSIDIVPVFGHIKRGVYVSSHLHLNVTYVFIADENRPLRVKPDENSGVMWVPLSKLDEYANEPYLVAIYRKIVEKAQNKRL